MKTLLLRRFTALFLLALSCYYANAQSTNYVLNSGFEDGTPVCSFCPNNGNSYLGGGCFASHWLGIQYGFGVQPDYVNTGSVLDNNSPCLGGKFAAGYSAAAGNRSIVTYLNYSNGTYILDVGAVGDLTTALPGDRLYEISMKLNGFPLPPDPSLPFNTVLQIFLENGSGSTKLAGEINVPNTANLWTEYHTCFTLSANENGKYNKVELRYKRFGGSSSYQAHALIDEFKILEVKPLTVSDVAVNTLCAPGASSPAVTPRFTVNVTGGVPPYTYNWHPITPINTTTLNPTNGSGNPTVASAGTNNTADYDLEVNDQSQCTAPVHFRVHVKFNLNPTFDLAMRDSYFDKLDEPNSQKIVDPNRWDIWNSPDLWNRQSSGVSSPGDNQDACYGCFTNIMNVEVRNVGCRTYTASPLAHLKLYWTIGHIGQELWEDDWKSNTPFKGHSKGNNFADLQLAHSIVPGGTDRPTSTWSPPNPGDYYPGASDMELCYLARIEDANGMTIQELTGTPVSENVTNNNNIVTRNTKVVSINKRDPHITWVLAGNSYSISRNYTLQFIQEGDAGILGHVTIKLSLGEIFTKWVSAGGLGSYTSIDPANRTVTFNAADTLQLEGIPLDPEDQDPIMISFSVNPDSSNNVSLPDGILHFRQLYMDSSNVLKTDGNYTFFIHYNGDSTDITSDPCYGDAPSLHVDMDNNGCDCQDLDHLITLQDMPPFVTWVWEKSNGVYWDFVQQGGQQLIVTINHSVGREGRSHNEKYRVRIIAPCESISNEVSFSVAE